MPAIKTISIRAASVALAAVLLAACGESAVQTADANVVNMYNWTDCIAADTLEKFTAEIGIRVNHDIYDSSGVVDVKLLAGNSGYDVVVHSNQFGSRCAPIGVFEKFGHSRIPNIRNFDPVVMERSTSTGLAPGPWTDDGLGPKRRLAASFFRH